MNGRRVTGEAEAPRSINPAPMVPRVAYFADTLHEINGVALTSREFMNFAKRRNYPMMVVHRGTQERLRAEGSLRLLELPRSMLAIGMDRDLRFDPLCCRDRGTIRRCLEEFEPDVIHVTSPGDLGILGAWMAHGLRIPLAASWHTNLHEFGARRLEKALWWVPAEMRTKLAQRAETWILDSVLRFQNLAQVHFAPNPELCRLIREYTGKPVGLMLRGIDTARFQPGNRSRQDNAMIIGYTGRLTPEKGLRILPEVERLLLRSGFREFRFAIVGDGSERTWLKDNLRQASFPGVLKGEPLTRAYANMDVFVFPSRTDTFGNVVQEAMASGVPAIVTRDGGPKYLVEHEHTGFHADTAEDFARAILRLANDEHLHRAMRLRVREAMENRSWEAVFEGVYRGYAGALGVSAIAGPPDPRRRSDPKHAAGLAASPP